MQKPAYWQNRFALLEKALTKDSATFYKEIERKYNRAIKDLEKDLSYWYGRFAQNEGTTLAEAKKILDKGELAAFKMSVEDYIKRGESLDPKWAKELERASIKVHVSRLEAMKLQMQQHAEELAAQMSMQFEDFAENAYAKQYYHTAYEVQKGVGVGWAFNKIDKNQIKKVISKPWARDGRNFSERIWSNRTKLVNELHGTLTSAIARGENPAKTIKELSTKMETSKFNAGRVIMTESAFINSAATKDALKSLDVEQYEILATLDRKTSPICREMDGKVFDMKDYEIGVTAPPFHPFCRTTTVPYFDDDEEDLTGGFRASRGDDGKYYLVPEDMTYKEWEKAFVDGSIWNEDNLKLAPREDPAAKFSALLEEARKAQQKVKSKKSAASVKNIEAAYSASRKKKALKAQDNADLASIRTKTMDYINPLGAKDDLGYSAAYVYTTNAYHEFNRPLAGYNKTWSRKDYVGPNNINIDNEGRGKEIRRLTEFLAHNTYDQDIWVKRGCNKAALENFLDLEQGGLDEFIGDDLAMEYEGFENTIYNFLSTSAIFSEDHPFITRAEVVMNIYAPKGTPMVYVAPMSRYQSEQEMLLQRGLTYRITGIKRTDRGKIEVDLEVRLDKEPKLIQQEE